MAIPLDSIIRRTLAEKAMRGGNDPWGVGQPSGETMAGGGVGESVREPTPDRETEPPSEPPPAPVPTPGKGPRPPKKQKDNLTPEQREFREAMTNLIDKSIRGSDKERGRAVHIGLPFGGLPKQVRDLFRDDDYLGWDVNELSTQDMALLARLYSKSEIEQQNKVDLIRLMMDEEERRRKAGKIIDMEEMEIRGGSSR